MYTRTPRRDRRSKWAMPRYGYGGIKRSGLWKGRRGQEASSQPAGGSWQSTRVPSRAPFMGEKTAAIIVYANCLKYPRAKAVLLPPPSPTSFRGRRFVKTFRDSSTTAGDGDVDDVCRSGIPANEEIRSLDFPGRSSSLIVWKGEFEFVFPLNGE